MYKLITSEGKISRRKQMNLKQMQNFVGGYIEFVGNIICNEDGKLKDLPINRLYPKFVGNIIIKIKI